MDGEAEFFSIVLLGHMNPRIHHPAWYRSAGIVDEATEEKALSDPETACVQLAAQFKTDAFKVVCAADRWQIQTEDLNSLQRLADIAGLVFDEKLHETRIQALGLNFNYHRKTTLPEVSRFIAQKVVGTTLGLEEMGATSAKLSVHRQAQGRNITVNIEPSVRGEQLVYVSHNFEYPAPNEEGLFDIRPLIAAHLGSDHQEGLRAPAACLGRSRKNHPRPQISPITPLMLGQPPR